MSGSNHVQLQGNVVLRLQTVRDPSKQTKTVISAVVLYTGSHVCGMSNKEQQQQNKHGMNEKNERTKYIGQKSLRS